MNLNSLPLKYYIALIKGGIPFSFVRYGDGEWHAILGDPGENCDGHAYFESLGKELSDSLHQPFFHATIPAVKHVGMMRVGAYLAKHNLRDMEWHDGNVFVVAALKGELLPLVQEMRNRRLVYVGPHFLLSFATEILGAERFLTVPAVNCYLQIDVTMQRLRSILDQNPPDIVGFSASMTTNALISRLFPDYGDRTTFIDFGSLFDPFPDNGRISRKYMKYIPRDVLLRANFGEWI